MKRHRVAGNSLIPMIAVVFSLVTLLPAGGALALPITDCSGCHGSSSTDWRPLDSVDGFRHITSGSFKGNHSEHMGVTTSANSCAKCHGSASNPVSGYVNAHRNGGIDMLDNINASPATATYSKGVFFNQTSVPTLGTCSNVNCHFETTGTNGTAQTATPVWGSANYSSPADCNQCHGAAPTDGNHPYGTQKHGVYYGTDTGSCVMCHTDHTAEATPFQHATSASNRGLTIVFDAAPNSGFGRYTGNVSYPNYLPSKNPPRNGTCQSLYCHSNGTVGTAPYADPNKRPVWGGSLGCNGCHKADKAVANDPMATGSHAKHVDGNYSAYNCVKCHAATVDSSMAIASTANHVTKLVNVAFNNTTTAVNGTYGGTATPMTKDPGSAYAACNNVYCHSNVQPDGGVGAPTYRTPTWGGTAACGTCHDGGSGHGDSTPMATGSHTRHLAYNLGTTSSAARCAVCHNIGGGTIADSENCSTGYCHSAVVTKHSDHNVDVSIVTFFGGTYAGDPKPGDGYSSCSSVYCHSDGQGTPTYAPAITWGSAALNCTSCHGSATAAGPSATNLSGKHAAHVNNDATLGTNNSFGCVDCHQKTVADNTTLNATTGYAAHVNKFIDYTGLRAGGPTRYSTATKQCSNFYCHSNGNATSLVYVNPAVWNSATTYDCNGCHGTGNAIGTPDYANGGAGTATANSHNKHVTEAGITATTGCANCHYRTVDAAVAGKLRNYSTLHLNSVENVDFKLIGGKTGTYDGTAKTCSATYCHGTAASPAWGSPSLACNNCHSASNVLPGAHNQHWETATLATSYALEPINSGDAGSYQFNCSSCHAPGSTLAVHANGPADAIGAGQVFYGFTSATRKGSYTYGTTEGTPADNGFAWTDGSCATTYCHSNGNGGDPVNAAFTWASASGTLGCGGCHNKAGDTWSATGTTAHTKHVTSNNSAGVYTCDTCHNLTASSNTALADKTYHVNKVKDISGSLISNTYQVLPVGTCTTDCHGKTTPKWNETSTGCNFCHPYDVGSWNTTSQRWTAQLSATSEGFGAHEKHIAHLKTLNGISLVAGTDIFGGATYVKVCGACHTNLKTNHIDVAAGNARSLNFGDGTYAGKTSGFSANFGGTATYNGASGTSSSVNPKNCLNTSCHTGTAPVWAPY